MVIHTTLFIIFSVTYPILRRMIGHCQGRPRIKKGMSTLGSVIQYVTSCLNVTRRRINYLILTLELCPNLLLGNNLPYDVSLVESLFLGTRKSNIIHKYF